MSMAVKAWSYSGRDVEGRLVKGKLDAPTQGAVITRLKGMGVAPVEIAEARAGSGLNREISLGDFGVKKVKLKELAVMSRQMATMISAGLSLLRTLSILAEQTESKKLRQTLTEVKADVEGGGSLSSSMAKHPDDFPMLMVSLVRAGETGGFLEGALTSVAENYEKEHKLRSTIKSAMTYPVVVLFMTLLAVVGMVVFIVPVFKTMFEGLGTELPLPTRILVGASESAIVWVPVTAVLAIAFSIWWGRNKNTERVRSFADRLKLRLPVFGILFKKIAVARFTRNLSTMLKSGVPILLALGIVGETSGNWVIENALRKVQDSVRTGKSIAGPLSEESVFPSMVTQMVAVGEDSGSLEQMLSKISDFYDDEVQATTEALTSLIEPIMIAVLGVIVGGMIIALYLPIFGIAGAMGG